MEKKKIPISIVIILLLLSPFITVHGDSLKDSQESVGEQNFYSLKLVKHDICRTSVIDIEDTQDKYYSDQIYNNNTSLIEKSNMNFGNSISQTKDGGFIIAGSTKGESEYDYYDVFLIKTDTNGKQEWNKTFWFGEGNSVQQTKDNGYIIAGCQYLGSDFDVLLIKTDENGVMQWEYSYDSYGWDYGNSVQQTDDGGFIIVGKIINVTSNMLVFKTDQNGNVEWSSSYANLDFAEAKSVEKTQDGEYIITGYTSSSPHKAFLLKIDKDGNEQWHHTYEGLGETIGYSAIQTEDQGYVITGYTYEVPNNKQSSILLIKTDEYGNEIWSKHYLVLTHTQGYSVHLTKDNKYVITGSTWSGDEVCAFLLKTDEQGNQELINTYEGLGYSSGKCVRQTNENDYILTGSTRHLSSNYRYVFLSKIQANGNQLWYKIFEWVNTPPNKPEIPDGPTKGKKYRTYTYTTSTTDKDGDLIYYMWDWDDPYAIYNPAVGPYISGAECSNSHFWREDVVYNIRVIAMDHHSGFSEWSDPLPVSIQKNRAVNTPLFIRFSENNPRLFLVLQKLFRLNNGV